MGVATTRRRVTLSGGVSLSGVVCPSNERKDKAIRRPLFLVDSAAREWDLRCTYFAFFFFLYYGGEFEKSRISEPKNPNLLIFFSHTYNIPTNPFSLSLPLFLFPFSPLLNYPPPRAFDVRPKPHDPRPFLSGIQPLWQNSISQNFIPPNPILTLFSSLFLFPRFSFGKNSLGRGSTVVRRKVRT